MEKDFYDPKLDFRIYESNQEIEYLDKEGCATYISRHECGRRIVWDDGDNKARFDKVKKSWKLEIGDLNLIQRLEFKYQNLMKL